MSASDRLPPFPDEGHRPSRRKLARAAEVAHLAELPLFANCSKRELRHLATSTRLELIEPDQVLFSEGRPSREAYIVVAGRVVVRRKRRKIAELGAGEFVGELGLLLHRNHSATATAKTPVEVLVLPQVALREAVEEVPGLGWKLLQTVAARMNHNTTRRTVPV
jgi:CRP-like cAMP-binding protein